MDEAEIIQTGKTQTVRLPRGYQFKGDKVYVKRVGNAMVLIPEDNPWEAMVDSLDQFSSDFMSDRQQPADDDRREMFK